MKSVMTKKSILNLSVCLMTVFILASCATHTTRDIAQEHKNDIAKIEDNDYAPHKFHAKRFERNNEY